MPRFYLPQTLQPKTTMILPETLAHHLRVLRCKPQDLIRLFDGQGHEISARILSIDKKSVSVRLEDPLIFQEPPRLKLHLGQSLCRFDRMDLILQKAVELNVSEITPLHAMRSQGRLSEAQVTKKMTHWREILIAACEQSGQNHLPRLHHPLSLEAWVKTVSADLKLIFALQKSQSLKTIHAQAHQIALLIGPEGDFSEEELEAADHHHFKRVSLGERILRVETAALLALGLVQYQFTL